MEFEIGFRGHENVRLLHSTTIEVTAEEGLTPRGDCILGVGASCACAGLPGGLKRRMRDPGAELSFLFSVGGLGFEVRGRGDPGLSLTHPTDLVVRRSGFVCPRTAAVRCDAASDSVPREMAGLLRDPRQRGTLVISAR